MALYDAFYFICFKSRNIGSLSFDSCDQLDYLESGSSIRSSILELVFKLLTAGVIYM